MAKKRLTYLDRIRITREENTSNEEREQEQVTIAAMRSFSNSGVDPDKKSRPDPEQEEDCHSIAEINLSKGKDELSGPSPEKVPFHKDPQPETRPQTILKRDNKTGEQVPKNNEGNRIEPSITDSKTNIRQKKNSPQDRVQGPGLTQVVPGSGLGLTQVLPGSGLSKVQGPGSKQDPGKVQGPGSKLGPGEPHVVSRVQGPGKNPAITLAEKQTIVYLWMLEKCPCYCNRTDIANEVGISSNTVKKAMDKLRKNSIISRGDSDRVNRRIYWSVDTRKKVILFDNRVQGPGRVLVGSRLHPGSRVQEGLRQGPGSRVQGPGSTSNKSVSKFLINLTDYINNSDFWKNIGLTIRRCEIWIQEFYPDESEGFLDQLRYAEASPDTLKPKKSGKTHLDVMYGILKNGGMARPTNYESPAQRRARIAREQRDLDAKAERELEVIARELEVIAADAAWKLFITESENVKNLIPKVYKSKKIKLEIKVYEETGNIGSNLMAAMRHKYEIEDESK